MAVGKIVAGIFILSLLAITESLKVPRNPDCTGVADFGKVEDPYNFTNYYTCYNENPMNHPTPCPNGGTFFGGNCGLPSYPPFTPTRTEGAASNCEVSCITGVSRVNDPSNCGTYYDCNAGLLGSAQQCPASYPHFNGITGMCVNDPSVCCIFTCDPVCATAKSFIPDYYNSTGYYWCPDVGVPLNHLQCSPGENYEISLGTCGPYPMWQSSCSASPSPVPPTSGCAESKMCAEVGYFPKCTYCDPEYFFCEHINQTAVVQKCTGVLLFSLDPLNPYCVLPNVCEKQL